MDQAVIALALVAGAVAAFTPCGFAFCLPTSGCWQPTRPPPDEHR